MNKENDTEITPSRWQSFRSVWHELVGSSTGSKVASKAQPEPLRAHIQACLEGQGGEVSARQRAGKLARQYLAFGPEDQLVFLRLLQNEFGSDDEEVKSAIQTLQAAEDPVAVSAGRAHLRKVLEPARKRLLRQFNMFQSGARFLVELRRELLDLRKTAPDLKPLEVDIKELLTEWFDVGFLQLEKITWDSPASLLEKVGRYEAVHPVRSWIDLKNRLESDRRCFAFFHPCMQDEPLIFIEVALVSGLADNIQTLLSNQHVALDPETADTAIFYSISNTQRGLDGIGFGNFLIKQVVDRLQKELPNLKQFATLSPIPGFSRWLTDHLEEELRTLSPKALKPLRTLADPLPIEEVVRNILGDPKWARNESYTKAMAPALRSLCARYLLNAKKPDGKRALDPVAHFHLTNGARMQRLNWLANTSTAALQQSAGMMINYLYRLDRIERFHEEYSGTGKINASSTITSLL